MHNVSELKLLANNKPYDSSAGFSANLPLLNKHIALNTSLRYDKILNMSALNQLPQRHMWHKFFPENYLSNIWTLDAENKEVITASKLSML